MSNQATTGQPSARFNHRLPAEGRHLKRHDLCGGWSFRQVGEPDWLPAQVPGSNFTDLLRNGRIADPFYRDNERALQWVEKEDWEYATTFQLSAADLALPQQRLVFEGLDTYAEVYLNGQLALQGSNMFRAYEAEVKPLLRAGENELLVRFRSPLAAVAAQSAAAGFTYPAGNDHSEEKLSVFARKAPYHYGWDWGPRFVTSGIWRPAYLLSYEGPRLLHAALTTVALHAEGGRVAIELEIEAQRAEPASMALDIGQGRWQWAQSLSLSPGLNRFRFELDLPGAEYWWPRGMGEPQLYELNWTLSQNGAACWQRQERFGLCDIRLVREADEQGHSFYFAVNGQPVFAKGANYIPQDSFLERAGEAHYRRTFEDMAAANMNMVRIWGGGIYEEALFYELADEYGIMVWQDFMFACSMYPGDEAFLQSVAEEAVYNLKRLKGHACLALWCGNNEIAVGWQHWGWQKQYGYTAAQCEQLEADYERLFEQLLPSLVAEHDPGRDYLSSSPMYDYSKREQYRHGDVHYWGVWHEEAPFEDYKQAVPRFMSEYGFQSFPLLPSVENYTLPEDRSVESDVMQLHQKHPRGNSIIRKYLLADYAPPKDFEDFLYLSQVLQAEGIRTAIEAHRLAKPFCMGTLYWQLNDCWPVASWSGIDYYGRWKALHYAVGRAFQPIIAVPSTEGADWHCALLSDMRQAQSLSLRTSLYLLDGRLLYTEEQQLHLPANGKSEVSWRHLQAAAQAYAPEQLSIRFQIHLEQGLHYENSHYLVPPKALALHPPKLSLSSRQEGGSLIVKLRAEVVIKNLCLWAEGLNGNFSDNFFDLYPGADKEVRMDQVEGLGSGVELRWTAVGQ